MIKIPKTYFAIPDLCDHWKCRTADVARLIIEEQIVPSYHVDGKFTPCNLEYDPESGRPMATMTAMVEINGTEKDSSEQIVGLRYLHLPYKKSATYCEFSCFHDSSSLPDWGETFYWSAIPWTLDDVLKNGVVTAVEVARFDAEQEAGEASERPLSHRERSNLLTTIGALLRLLQIPIPERPDTSSQAKIIDVLQDLYPTKGANSKRHLETVFALAKKHFVIEN